MCVKPRGGASLSDARFLRLRAYPAWFDQAARWLEATSNAVGVILAYQRPRSSEMP